MGSHRTARTCVVVIALAAGLLCGGCSGQRPSGSGSERPDVLLIVIDTIRADHMSAYGYARRTTPHIDTLAESGVKYLRALSQAPWTTPSMGSLLSSAYPTTLGIRHVQSALPQELPLLQEVLREAGYATGGVVSHSFCSAKWGFARGFDEFDESNIREQGAVTSPGVTERAIEFLDAHRDRPWFLMLHYFDPHFVYVLHEEFPFKEPGPDYDGVVKSGMKLRELRRMHDQLDEADLAQLDRIYDSEIALTDHYIGKVFAHLRELGLYDETLIVLTGDHGEEFFDHGRLGHAKTLYNELLNVPLIIKYPGGLPAVVEQPVGLIDVYPTVLDFLRLPRPETLQGRSLLNTEQIAGAARAVFSETSRLAELRSVVAGSHKLIYDLKRQRAQLFDIYEDPGDRRDLSGEHPEQVQAMMQKLNRWLESSHEARAGEREVELSEEERERLRALGYL